MAQVQVETGVADLVDLAVDEAVLVEEIVVHAEILVEADAALAVHAQVATVVHDVTSAVEVVEDSVVDVVQHALVVNPQAHNQVSTPLKKITGRCKLILFQEINRQRTVYKERFLLV